MTTGLTFPARMKLRSIKAKLLVALLALSLLPLILFVVISRFSMVDAQEHVESGLIRDAKEHLVQLAEAQADIANAMLDTVEAATQLVAFFAAEKLNDPHAASVDTPTPGISMAAANPELDLFSNLEKVFVLIHENAPYLTEIYYGTQSGFYWQHPRDTQEQDSPGFTLKPAFAQHLNGGGEISEQLWQVFRENGVSLSRHAVVSSAEPGNTWLIRDVETQQSFSVRQGKIGLDVYREYDPRIRPWYLNAVNQNSVVWTKYATWNLGEWLFSLDKQLEPQLADKVSPSLARAIENKKIFLSKNSPLSIEPGGTWTLQDKNGKYYKLRKENDQLNVYSSDILTCSRAVLDPQGHLAGVVGLDISMDSIRRKIIDTPAEIPGYAFLLNAQGELVEQEKADMFIPEAGGGIRRKMAGGQTGIEFDAGSASYVSYAPIRSSRRADRKSFWSVGVSMPEREITRLADDIQQKMALVFKLLMGILASMIILVTFAAFRMSKGITRPILALNAHAKRIGSGDLDHRLDVGTGDEIEELANAFNKMTGDLKTYIENLRKTTAEKERIEGELRVAHDIQMSFLKKIFPPFPDRSDFSLYATIAPAKEVGGDLYDFVLMDENRLVFYIGDVSDKGVPASLVMAMTMTLMKRAAQQPGITPAEILRQVNVALSEDNEHSMFVTLFIGILNLKTGELSFSNAGHNPPLILGADGESRFLTLPEGLVLGVMPEAEYSDDSVRLAQGDMVVTYTDGVTEAMNPERALYSEARLQGTLTTLAGHNVEDTVGEIIASVRTYAAGAPQSDDIAVLAVMR